MKRLHISAILLSLMALASVVGNAQEVSPVDFMRMNPFQVNSNAATSLPYNSFFHLGIGNVNADIQNTNIRFEDLFGNGADGSSTAVNLKKFADGLEKDNMLNFGFTENIFGFGCDFMRGKITYWHRLRAQGSMQFDDGLFKFMAYGNSAYMGDDGPASLNVGLDMTAFQEIAIDYQMDLNNKLSVGIRAKILFGMARVETDAFSMKMYTSPVDNSIYLHEDIRFRTYLPRIYSFTDGRFDLGERVQFQDLFRNAGFGVDFAAQYKIDDKWSVVAAVNDLGHINWSRFGKEVYGNLDEDGQLYQDGTFFHDGLDFNEIKMIFNDENYGKGFIDTLGQYFNLQSVESPASKTKLHTDILLRGNYDLDKYSRVSAQLQGYCSGIGLRPALTLAYSGSFFKKIDVAVTYTMKKKSFDNLGVGLGLNLGCFHFYATTNNLFGLLKPLSSRVVNVQAGFVLNFWAHTKARFVEFDNIEY